MHAWREQVSGTVRPVEQVQDLAWHERLGSRQIWNEKVLSGVRLAQGFDVGDFATYLDKEQFPEALSKAIALGWIDRASAKLVPSVQGREQADALAELFFNLVA